MAGVFFFVVILHGGYAGNASVRALPLALPPLRQLTVYALLRPCEDGTLPIGACADFY